MLVTSFDLSCGSCRTGSKACLCFNWLRDVLLGYVFSTVTGAMDIDGASKKQMESLEGEAEGEILGERGGVKCPHIPESLEGPVHAQDWIHAQKRPKKTVRSHFQLTLRLWTCRKWKLWQSCKLLGWALKSTPTDTWADPQRLKEFLFSVFLPQVIKESLSNH